MCDSLERATGTDPYDADTDGDGVLDGEEDANQDGRVDVGESDPRAPGLFPGTAPYIPEPLVFDLVRGLGAERGELEANTLVLTTFDRSGRPRVAWAPEVEWAILDGFAVEAEFPMEGSALEALKGAVQVTLPGGNSAFAHGVQGIAEYFIRDEATEASLLYLVGARSSAWSVFTMMGGRTTWLAQRSGPEFLLNPSVFYDVGEQLTIGVETNLALGRGERELLLIPQLHYQISHHLRVQVGGGMQVTEEHRSPLLTTRIILE